MSNQYEQFCLHEFTSKQDVPFSPVEYSRFKFGDQSAAKKMGFALADAFFKAHAADLVLNQTVVVPSPYSYVKNAASCMAHYFYKRINHLLAEHLDTHVEWNLISRKLSYTSDFGFLDEKQRKALLEGDSFFFNSAFLKGKTVILIDDVFITGTHEKKLRQQIDLNCEPAKVFFLYFGKKSGADFPEVEAYLNFAGISDVRDYINIINENNYEILIRPIKYLMNLSEQDFAILIKEAPVKFLARLYYLAIAENYFRVVAYQDNFVTLKKHLKALNALD